MKTIRNAFAGALVAVSLLATAFAAEPPPPAEPRPFKLPELTRFSLDNGLDVTLVPFGNVPKVDVHVVVRTGNVNEGEQRWLTDYTAALLKEGTTLRDGSRLATDAASMGGELMTLVTEDQTLVIGSALAEFAPQLVGLLAEMVRTPAFAEDDAERVRADLRRQLDVELSRAQAQADEAFLRQFYGDHAYGDIYPSPEQLDALDAAAARAFHEGNFGAARTHVYVAGMFDPAATREAIEKAFAEWQAGPAPEPNPPGKLPAPQRLTLIDRPGAPQSSLVIGLPVVDPTHEDYVRLQVMNALLGGSFGSRITSNIREDKGYTYSPYSFVRERYRHALWEQHADVTTEHTADSVREILNEIRRLHEEAPSEAELAGIRNYLAGVFVLQASSRFGLINQLRRIDLHGLPPDTLETYAQRINAVTPEEVRGIAARYLDPQKMALVIVGDLAKVRPQLESLEWPGETAR